MADRGLFKGYFANFRTNKEDCFTGFHLFRPYFGDCIIISLHFYFLIRKFKSVNFRTVTLFACFTFVFRGFIFVS